MKLTLDLKKSIEENASVYFDKAKKAKKKLEGALEALEKSKKELEKIEKLAAEKHKTAEEEEEEKIKESRRKKHWYERFRWFISSEGFLCVGGRDATSNEILIKKQTEKHDIVFHSDMAGSPFFVVKTENKKPGKKTEEETAQATASYSRAWRKGLATLEIFKANPEQVSKTAKSGEYLTKGAFMIYGKVEYFQPKIGLSIGMAKDGLIMAGPKTAVEKHCSKHVEIMQGNQKTSSIAKLIQKRTGGNLDEIIRALPAGGCKIKNDKR